MVVGDQFETPVRTVGRPADTLTLRPQLSQHANGSKSLPSPQQPAELTSSDRPWPSFACHDKNSESFRRFGRSAKRLARLVGCGGRPADFAYRVNITNVTDRSAETFPGQRENCIGSGIGAGRRWLRRRASLQHCVRALRLNRGRAASKIAHHFPSQPPRGNRKASDLKKCDPIVSVVASYPRRADQTDVEGRQ
jgi:hypothetical protein